MAPQVGQRFPSITLLRAGNKEVRVPEGFEGKNVVLTWYPYAFSPVCTEEYTGFTGLHQEFAARDAALLAVSCDHWYSAEAYKAKLGAPFPFLSDWTKEAAKALGILHAPSGASERAIYLLDREGVLRWQRVYERRTCPRIEDFRDALDGLR